MKFFFFLVHPSKYNVFKNTINSLIDDGHTCDIAIISKDVLEQLVRNEGWNYINIFPEGRRINGIPLIISVGINTVRTVYRLNKLIRKKNYDLFITDDLLVINGKLKKIPSILFQDDDISAVPESAPVAFFANYILSPSVSNFGKYNHKKINFYGYKELGSLHPNKFKPDYSVVEHFNPTKQRYFLLRLVSLKATHDVGKSGLNNIEVKKIISLLENHGEVFITAQRDMPEEFEKYRIKIRPNDIAHALYFADLLISDSQTMSAEAGVLGTPYIRFNDFVGKISYLDELENKYHLGIGIRTADKSDLFKKIEELIKTPNLKDIWKEKRKKMLSEKIDLSDFMYWLFVNYPKSIEIIKENPEYQLKFK